MPTTIPAEALYRTSTLVESFAQIPSAPSFLKDNLFPRSVTSSSDLISVEFFRGNQKLAPFVSRFSKGSAVPREREQLSLFSPPFIKPVRNLTADDLFYRSAPTPAAGGPENREVELLARDFTELDLLVSRREEWMASECLFTGKVKCVNGDSGEITAELIYGTPSKTVLSKLWSDPASDPLSDLRGAMRLVANQCGSSADLVVMGSSAADAFESNPNVLNAFDKMRVSPGQLAPARCNPDAAVTQLLAGGEQPVASIDQAAEFLAQRVQRCFRDDTPCAKPSKPRAHLIHAAINPIGRIEGRRG